MLRLLLLPPVSRTFVSPLPLCNIRQALALCPPLICSLAVVVSIACPLRFRFRLLLPLSAPPRDRRADRHLRRCFGPGRFRPSASNDAHPVLCSLPANFNRDHGVYWRDMHIYLESMLQYYLHRQLTMERDINATATLHAPIAQYTEQLNIGNTI